MKKLPILVLASITMMGCDIPTPSYVSDDWRNIIKGTKNDCPDISGTYSITDEPGYQMLGGHYEAKPKQWATMNISGNPQQELNITLYEAKTGISNSAPIKRVRGKDYHCEDGLLATGWPHGVAFLTENDETVVNGDHDQIDRSLSFGKNKMGELIVRGNIRTWKGIAVWCGDGCKYLPIPLTGRTLHQYSRWPSTTIPVAKIISPTLSTAEATAPSLTPNDTTPEGRVTAILDNFLPTHVKLVQLVNTGNNQWKATFQGSANGLIALHEELQTTTDIQIIDLQMNRSSPIKEFVTEFRLAPTKEEIAAKKAKETEARQLATRHEAEHRALVKKLLPSMPKGMIITASHHDANGFLVELRYKDEDGFYQLQVNAVASGEFATANIKTQKAIDNYGMLVKDVLFTLKNPESKD